jgi:spermidine/putrescine transport system permease protein
VWGAVRSKLLLGLPSFSWTLVFFLVPIGLLLAYSFGQIDIITFKVQWGWTFGNYGDVFDPLYLKTIGRSLLLALAGTVGALILGFPMAYYISLQSGRRQLVLLLAVMVPFWTSFLVRTYAMTNLLAKGGPVDTVWGWLGGDPLNVLYTPWAVGLGILYSYLPLMILPLYAAIERLPRDLGEAAQDLGASRVRQFFTVTLPLTRTGVAAGCIFVFVPSLGNFLVPDLLGGGRRQMVGNLIQVQFLKARDWPFGATLALAVILLMAVVLVIQARLASRDRLAEEVCADAA